MPAVSAGYKECDGCTVDTVWNSFAGPFCYCASPAAGYDNAQYCNPGSVAPEQINLQVASQDVVVASFVTHDKAMPSASSPPVAMFGETQASSKPVNGVSHYYKQVSDSEGMNYILHFVKFDSLKPSTTYTYKVKSGADGALWSAWFNFTSLGDATGPTRIGMYGDMGHSHFNPMANLLADCQAGSIEAIVHMGDHAYGQ
jgi:hypothetical protein